MAQKFIGEGLIDEEPTITLDEKGEHRHFRLLKVISRDGIGVVFGLTINENDPVPPHIELYEDTTVNGTDPDEERNFGSIPLAVVTEIGRGRTILGLETLALQASLLRFGDSPVGTNPLMEANIIPFFGGQDRFDDAMRAAA